MEFRGHSKRSSQLGLGHVMATLSESEITNNDGIVVQENVSQFEVSVHDLILVEDLEAVHDLLQVVNSLLVGEVAFKVSIVAVLHDQVIVIAGLQELV